MVIASTDVTAGLGFTYPVAFVISYLTASIVLKVRDIRGHSNSRAEVSTAQRAKVVFCLLCVSCMGLLAAVGMAVYAGSVWQDGQYWWTSKPFIASQVAVFLLFFSSLLPDPDTPYRPSAINGFTWLTAVVFETALAILGSLNISKLTAAPNGLRRLYAACLLLGYIRIVCLVLCCNFLYETPEKEGDSESSTLLGSDGEDVGHYGATEAPKKTPTPLIDAQSTNWLDYLVGFGKLFPLLWPATFPLQIRALICIGILIAQRVVNVMVPFQLGAVVSSLGFGVIPYRQLFIYVCCRAIQGQQGVLASIRALLWIPIGQATYRRLTESAFSHVLCLSLEFHLGKRLGEVMSALNKGSALNTFLDSLIFQLFPMVADVGVAAGYLLVTFDPLYALIIITMGWTYLFVTIYMAKYRGRARREMINRDREMDAVKTDAIMSYEVVQYNDAVLAEQSRFSDGVTAFQKAEYSVLVSLNTLNGVQNLIFTVGVLLVSLVSAFNISVGAETVGVFVSLITYLVQLQAPLSFFGSFYTQIQNNLIDAERMLALFNEEPTVIDKPNAIEIKEIKGRVTFEDVSFAYDNRKPALENINFDVKPGTSVAIVGESGSGKSTLLRLLYRFYNVTDGCIKIDGRPVDEITINSLRNHFGVVPQETMLFNDTLMYNLLYANPSANEEHVFAACKAASVHDKIMAFPDGYQTQVGERGLRLSGGEKQRITIARAILKSPRVVLMDEATASLDSETEKYIQASLAELSKNKTIITIAHRLSTIVHCDEIIVLHQGRIVEKGTHVQLLTKQGRYQQMWDKQTKKSS